MEWFSEHCPMWPGMALSVETHSKLLDVQTSFQHVQVYATTTYGNMLVLDGKIQCTERDEFAYHEMLVHPAMFSHPNPERVLIIGGGDGGALREVGKHACVRQVTLCEIDEAVMSAAKRFFPGTACGLTLPNARIVCADALEWLAQCEEVFDVILVDSSDPFGPAEALFETPFYQTVRSHLAPNGVVAAQSEHYFIHVETVQQLKTAMTASFPYYLYLPVVVPSYPGGGVGMALAALDHDLHTPLREPDEAFQRQLRYYSPELHRTASILPRFAMKEGEC